MPNEDKKFFELLTRLQGDRLDDQRGIVKQFQIPDFLKSPTSTAPAAAATAASSSSSKAAERREESGMPKTRYSVQSLPAPCSQQMTARFYTPAHAPAGTLDRSSLGLSLLNYSTGHLVSGTLNEDAQFRLNRTESLERDMDASFRSEGLIPSSTQAERYFAVPMEHSWGSSFWERNASIPNLSQERSSLGQRSSSGTTSANRTVIENNTLNHTSIVSFSEHKRSPFKLSMRSAIVVSPPKEFSDHSSIQPLAL